MLIFPFDYGTSPTVINLRTDEEYTLPPEANHGPPINFMGTRFSPSEDYLLYEDWQDFSLRIYDFQERTVADQISDKGFFLLEASWSPDEKKIAYLKWDKNESFIHTEGDGRPPVGHIASIYDLKEEKSIMKISGLPYIYWSPIWSPDGKQLILNMAASAPNKIDLIGNPYRYNMETGELVELTTPVSGTIETYGVAWSGDNRKVLIKSLHENQCDWLYWEVDLDTSLATEIDKGNQYISISNRMGTSIYEVIAITNPILKEIIGDRYEERHAKVFPGGKHALLEVSKYEVSNSRQLIVAPLH